MFDPLKQEVWGKSKHWLCLAWKLILGKKKYISLLFSKSFCTTDQQKAKELRLLPVAEDRYPSYFFWMNVCCWRSGFWALHVPWHQKRV